MGIDYKNFREYYKAHPEHAEMYSMWFSGQYWLKLWEFLNTSDFFIAPASTRFHGATKHGLAEHSFYVAKGLQYLTDRLGLEWADEDSPILIGALHDLCKVNNYDWDEESKVYRYKPNVEEGHGSRSVKILKDLGVKLSLEEETCIAYHMGTWTNDIDPAIGDITYTGAVQKYPNVLWTHTIDMYVSQVLKI